MVPLLHHHEGDARLVVLLQLDAGLADGQQLVLEHLYQPQERQTGEEQVSTSQRLNKVNISARRTHVMKSANGG